MKEGLELTIFQMTPGSLRSMIIQGTQGSTFWTGAPKIFLMARPYIRSLIHQIQLNLFNYPWGLYSKKVTVKFSISHGSSPPRSYFTLIDYPLKSRMNQFFNPEGVIFQKL